MTQTATRKQGRRSLQNRLMIPDPFEGDIGLNPYDLQYIGDKLELKINWHALGCGSFGCVFATEDPGIVVKLSSDELEGPTIQAIIETGKHLPGVIEYHEVYRYNDVWVIVRDSALIPNKKEEKLITSAPWFEDLQNYRELALQWIFDHDKDARDEALLMMRELSQLAELSHLAYAVKILSREGILIGDLHEGNLGFIDFEKAPAIKWYDGIKRNSLQCFDVGFSQFPKGTHVTRLQYKSNPYITAVLDNYSQRIEEL